MGRGFSPAGYFSLERCRESFGSVCLDGVNFFSRVIVYLLDFPSNFFSTEIGKAILIIQSQYFLDYSVIHFIFTVAYGLCACELLQLAMMGTHHLRIDMLMFALLILVIFCLMTDCLVNCWIEFVIVTMPIQRD